MAKSGYSMRQAYADAGKPAAPKAAKPAAEGSPKEEKSESKAEAKREGDTPFISKKIGTQGTMVKCPECGAHFTAKYS